MDFSFGHCLLLCFLNHISNYHKKDGRKLRLTDCPDQEVGVFYADRNRQVEALSKYRSISATDVHLLDKQGRIRIAEELWSLCDSTARNALLSDVSAQVRNAAKFNLSLDWKVAA